MAQNKVGKLVFQLYLLAIDCTPPQLALALQRRCASSCQGLTGGRRPYNPSLGGWQGCCPDVTVIRPLQGVTVAGAAATPGRVLL